MLLAVFLLGVALHIQAQVNNTRLRNQLTEYFKNYTNNEYVNTIKYGVDKVLTSESNRTVEVYANESFGMQPFTPERVDQIYSKIKTLLPIPYNTFTLTIYANGKDIRELVTAAWTNNMGERRHWGNVEYRGLSWTQNLSAPYSFKGGLNGRHLSLWASHGKYYSTTDHQWIWQRPHLFCTTEDLLTQSIAVPFLYPMLEHAGAIVFTPKERDWQRNEVVVDNDFPDKNGSFAELNGIYPWEEVAPGFSNVHEVLTDFCDPHREGTARIAAAQTNKRQLSTLTWTPLVPADGNYAVYVSYPVLPNAVPDAQYTVCHSGVNTTIRVNQQMGGSTWVYLGTFYFQQGQSAANSITLSNFSNYRGYVAGDAIRLGGGMGNVVRADMTKTVTPITPGLNLDSLKQTSQYNFIVKSPLTSEASNGEQVNGAVPDSIEQLVQYNYTNNLTRSGVARHLEAARYCAQWMGLPRELFSVKDGTYDYGDDINARPIATNYLARGSVYLPGDSGLYVPLELNLALHSDAGYKKDMEYVGSLAIHTSNIDEGMMPGGQSRMASRDFCDILLQQVYNDMSQLYGTWTRRQIFDRNYGETRIPRIPAAILEMFSHQNYADMRRAFDPVFKFQLARSIYKGILRFVSMQHSGGISNMEGTNNSTLIRNTAIVAPLPVQDFAAETDPFTHLIKLRWQPTTDPTEPSAIPHSYIVYTRTPNTDWDNGTVVRDKQYQLQPTDNQLYQFRVEALNDGGRSLPSETLCARLSGNPSARNILIMNGFQRLAGPEAVCTADSCGFDIHRDPGVSFMHTAEFCGAQQYFGWDGLGKETTKGMGYSGTELEGMLIVGNTFDYPVLHATDFLATGDYNISSCSRGALEKGVVNSTNYHMMDLIMGAQRNDGYSSLEYKTFTPQLKQRLQAFTHDGGSILLSGAYIGTDMMQAADQEFLLNIMHFTPTQEQHADTLQHIEGMGTKFTYMTIPNEQHLSTAYTSVIRPDEKAFATLVYSDNRQCAAVAYKGEKYNTLSLGFPIEQIQEADIRRNLMQAFVQFLLP